MAMVGMEVSNLPTDSGHAQVGWLVEFGVLLVLFYVPGGTGGSAVAMTAMTTAS